MTKEEQFKGIVNKWYAEERSPIFLDNKWFMDMELLAKELLEENARLKRDMQKIIAQCGIPSMAQAIREILDTAKKAVAERLAKEIE